MSRLKSSKDLRLDRRAGCIAIGPLQIDWTSNGLLIPNQVKEENSIKKSEYRVFTAHTLGEGAALLDGVVDNGWE